MQLEARRRFVSTHETALERIDASLDFVKPLIEPANITSHGRDDLEATGLGLFHTTDWRKEAATSYAEVRRLRDQVSSGQGGGAVLDLAVKTKSELAFRVAEKLKVLADEGLSFELELDRVLSQRRASARRCAPSSPAAPRSASASDGCWPGFATTRPRSWMRSVPSRVDRRAIAAVIAWEAIHNIMRAGLRGVGFGKMHTYDRKCAGVILFCRRETPFRSRWRTGASFPSRRATTSAESV